MTAPYVLGLKENELFEILKGQRLFYFLKYDPQGASQKYLAELTIPGTPSSRLEEVFLDALEPGTVNSKDGQSIYQERFFLNLEVKDENLLVTLTGNENWGELDSETAKQVAHLDRHLFEWGFRPVSKQDERPTALIPTALK